MAVHSGFRDLFGIALGVYHVLKQDFDFWVKEKACTGPDIVDVYELLGGKKRDGFTEKPR